MTKLPKNRVVQHALIAVFAVLALPVTSYSQLTYVDARIQAPANVTPTTGTIFSEIDVFHSSTDDFNDDLWRFRGDEGVGMGDGSFGAGGTILEAGADGGNTEDATELRQTITGLGSNQMVDVYVVWWTSVFNNWNVRAGLNSNPGANQLYDFQGTTGVAGSLGALADWAPGQLPPDGLVDDGRTGETSLFFENDRIMLLAPLGTGTADSSGNLDVFIDDAGGGVNRTWFDGVAYAPVGSNPTTELTATIDRVTGNLSLTASADVQISSIAINSGSGTLDTAAWNRIGGNLDGAGNSSFDSDLWETTSESSLSLAEAEAASPAVAGGTLGPSGAATINYGNVWMASPFEDVVLNITLTESGETVPIVAQFTGGAPQILGDFDNDTDIDRDDYEVVLRGLNQNLAGMTDFETYSLGDVNGDQVTNFNDLVAFRDIYDEANGTGAFAALVASVPEPTSLALMAMATVGLALKRRGRSLAMVLLMALVCVPSAAQAQLITYVDADHNTNTAAESGSPMFPSGASGDQGPLGDGLWDLRGFANNGSIYQNRGFNGNSNDPEDAHRLVTTISGLTNSETYEVFAYFWTDIFSNTWRINAGLTNDALAQFNPSNSPLAVEANFANDPLPIVSEDFGNRLMYQAELGIAIADGNGQISVYIDDNDPVSMGHNDRTWYDGVGFRIAPPELTIEVNTTTGAVSIVNPTDADIDFSYYEITSAGNSLNPAGWNSLDAQNIDAVDDRGGMDPGTVAGDSTLEGWDVAGGGGSLEGDHDGNGTVNANDLTTWQDEYSITLNGSDFLDWQRNLGESGGGAGSAGLLNETNLLGQSTVATMTGSLSLGNAYDTSVGAQDLVFRYGNVADGDLILGRVSYVSSASATNAVPEPSTALLAGLAIALACSGKRNRERC